MSADIDTFGLEQESNNTRKVDFNDNLYIGTLPAVDLGLSPEYVYDEFGNKLVYVVDANCTKSRGLVKCDTNDSDLIIMDTNSIKTKNIVFFIIAITYGTKDFIMNRLGMYDMGCLVDMNSTEISNNVTMWIL